MDLPTYIQQLDKTHSFDAFLKQFSPTPYPAVFRNEAVALNSSTNRPWLIIFNSVTAAGKDTIMDSLLAIKQFVKAKTATSRTKRLNEAEDHYVWMRKQNVDEDFDSYKRHLIEEYDLLESDAHHGNMYGLPRENLYTAAKHGVVIMQNEPNGARTLVQKLGNDFNVVVLFIVPDTWTQMLERMSRAHETRDNELTRLEDSLAWLSSSREVTHYYLHSTEFPETYGEYSKSGLELLSDSVVALVNDLRASVK